MALQRLKRDLRWNVPAAEVVAVDMQRSDVNKGVIIEEAFRRRCSSTRAGPRISMQSTPEYYDQAGRLAETWRHHRGVKCIHARDHGCGKAGGPPSPACVESFRNAFANSDEGKNKVAEVDSGYGQPPVAPDGWLDS